MLVMTFVTTSLKQSLISCLSRKTLKTQTTPPKSLPITKRERPICSQMRMEWLDAHLKTSVRVMVTEICGETHHG